jgi:hypothetical protein
MYKVESIALIPQEKANFTGGIVYMKAWFYNFNFFISYLR